MFALKIKDKLAKYGINIPITLMIILIIIVVIFGIYSILHYCITVLKPLITSTSSSMSTFMPLIIHTLVSIKDFAWIFTALFAIANVADIYDPSVNEAGGRAISITSDIMWTIIDIVITLICLISIGIYGF